MTNFLIKHFIKNWDQPEDVKVREKYGILASVVGIISNIFLFVIKYMVGSLAGSVSIMADAINNLSDSLSSIITLAGFILGRKPADKEHPFGHARFEYISGLFVSLLVMAVGLEFLKSSISKIISPEPTELTPVLAGVLFVTVIVKIWQGGFNKKIGEQIHSSALIATAADSMNDVYITVSVLVCAVIEMLTGWEIDGYVGVAVAIYIFYSGFQLVRGTIDELLGMAPDKATVEKIETKLGSYPIEGYHDLMVHTYGPERVFASVHVEVPANQDILISHELIDKIEREFDQELGISLLVHMDPIVLDDPKVNEWRKKIEKILFSIDPEVTFHDFRMVPGENHTNLIFDIVVPYDSEKKDEDIVEEIQTAVSSVDSNVKCVITCDRNYIATDSSEFN